MILSEELEKLLGQGNLKKLVPKSIFKQIEALFSPCCGFGRKIIKIVDADGNRASITSFPVTIDGSTKATREALEDNLAEDFGYGYAVSLISCCEILVISNRSEKGEDGLPNVPDTVVKS